MRTLFNLRTATIRYERRKEQCTGALDWMLTFFSQSLSTLFHPPVLFAARLFFL